MREMQSISFFHRRERAERDWGFFIFGCSCMVGVGSAHLLGKAPVRTYIDAGSWRAGCRMHRDSARWSRGTAAGAVWCSTLGFLTVLVWSILFGAEGQKSGRIHAIIPGQVVGWITFVLVSLMTKPLNKEFIRKVMPWRPHSHGRDPYPFKLPKAPSDPIPRRWSPQKECTTSRFFHIV